MALGSVNGGRGAGFDDEVRAEACFCWAVTVRIVEATPAISGVLLWNCV